MKGRKRSYTPKEKGVFACIIIMLVCMGFYVYKTYIYTAPEPEKTNSPLIIDKKKNQTTSGNETGADDTKVTAEDKEHDTAEQVFARFLDSYPTFNASKPTEHIEKVKDMLEPGFYQTLLTEQKNMTTVPQYQTTVVESVKNMSSKAAENDSVYWKADVTTVNKDKDGKALSTIETQYVATMKQVNNKWQIIDLMQQGQGAKLHE
ncbi:hypothetical protein ACRVLY_002901 [Listeria monocytogenes]|uniref:hypothetical protein n=1 Tax=Listeria monocytogenes TaxID=1639 RepID=UPI0008742920|nr:hypothetical protein [Listeria monocytogenes]EAC7182487.1 hypothetical protein [Listeria monocytogenes]EAC8000860.1 hypothetical protein [Listeria monocytogenes]EAC8351017.1 hypothetical protein [Listeria monocytogenes]EAD4096291.1 hypothetical protein [Listeria monocytogenes]EAD9140622.1 hypothetical protein [Listeria monocytogenes]